jgi:hypothetical protein
MGHALPADRKAAIRNSINRPSMINAALPRPALSRAAVVAAMAIAAWWAAAVVPAALARRVADTSPLAARPAAARPAAARPAAARPAAARPAAARLPSEQARQARAVLRLVRVREFEADLVADLNHQGGVPLAGNAYEVAGGPQLAGNPVNQTVFHWFDIRGYQDFGAVTDYGASVHGASSVGRSAGVPAYSSLLPAAIVAILVTVATTGRGRHGKPGRRERRPARRLGRAARRFWRAARRPWRATADCLALTAVAAAVLVARAPQWAPGVKAVHPPLLRPGLSPAALS